jgi:HEAT repeats
MVFGLFTRCPLDDPREKAWIETRMQWLSEQFGIDVLRNAEVLTPTPECFPEPYGGTLVDAERILDRLCGQLHVGRSGIRLQLHNPAEEATASGSADGAAEDAVIRITEPQLAEAQKLIATVARALCQRRLVDEKRLTGREADGDHLTDLMPVYFGAGAFAANSVIHEQTVSDGRWHTWSIARWGVLPARIFGHAFALFAWLRGESSPRWAEHLRGDARVTMLQSLKYLRKSEDSLFRPDTAGNRVNPLTFQDLADELKSGTPGRRIAALWQLPDLDAPADAVVSVLTKALRDRSPAILATALQSLADAAVPHEDAEHAVRLLMNHSHPEVRAMAVRAMAGVAVNDEESVQEIALKLQDANVTVVAEAAAALAQFGAQAMPVVEELTAPIKRTLVRRQVDVATACIAAVAAIHPDPEAFLRDHFQDPELLLEIDGILREIREHHTAAGS